MLRSRTALLRLSAPAPSLSIPGSTPFTGSSRHATTSTFKPFKPFVSGSALTPTHNDANYTVDSRSGIDAEFDPDPSNSFPSHGFGRRRQGTINKLVRKEKMPAEWAEDIRKQMRMTVQARSAVEAERKSLIKLRKEKQKKLIKRRTTLLNLKPSNNWTMVQGALLAYKKKHEAQVIQEWDCKLPEGEG